MTKTDSTSDAPKPVTAFIAYSHEDKRHLAKLHQHLSLLRNQGKLDDWHDRRIDPGQEWEQAIDHRLHNDRIILLLVSPAFIASKYCWEKEMRVAMQRHEAGDAIVIPIIVRDCDWNTAPFGKLEALPEKGKALALWQNRDSAWRNVAEGIRRILESPHSEQVAREVTGAASILPTARREVVERVKRFLSHPPQPILLHDLVMGEVERVRTTITSDPSYAHGTHMSGAEIAEQLPRYEALSESLMALFATGCRWSSPSGHQLWVDALERLSSLPVPDGHRIQPGFKVNLYRYPALLSLYAGGISAVAAKGYDMLASLLVKGSTLDYYNNKVPMILAVNAWGVLEIDVAKTLPGWDGWLPFNRHLCSNPQLRESLREFLPEDQQYDAALDRFEYLLGLVYWDLFSTRFNGNWAPASCFAWRDRNRDWDPNRMPVIQQLVEEINTEGENWSLLKAGLFSGSPERLISTMQAYNYSLATRPH
jgi:hypothetical protein